MVFWVACVSQRENAARRSSGTDVFYTCFSHAKFMFKCIACVISFDPSTPLYGESPEPPSVSPVKVTRCSNRASICSVFLSGGWTGLWLFHESLILQSPVINLALWADKEAPDSCFPDTSLSGVRFCVTLSLDQVKPHPWDSPLMAEIACACYRTSLWGLRWGLWYKTGKKLEVGNKSNWQRMERRWIVQRGTHHACLDGCIFPCTPSVVGRPGTRKHHPVWLSHHIGDGWRERAWSHPHLLIAMVIRRGNWSHQELGLKNWSLDNHGAQGLCRMGSGWLSTSLSPAGSDSSQKACESQTSRSSVSP